MQSARDRIAAAVQGKADVSTRQVAADDGTLMFVEHHPLAAVRAGDVVELGKDSADPGVRELVKGASAVAPNTVVYQRADQLRAMLKATE
ncbi:hypothetical protein J0H58_21630 [bacterium]|nr:hypothetical protein [bacterium]